MRPTRSSVRSHGMSGWFQAIHARCGPPGDRAGWARKSLSAVSARSADHPVRVADLDDRTAARRCGRCDLADGQQAPLLPGQPAEAHAAAGGRERPRLVAAVSARRAGRSSRRRRACRRRRRPRAAAVLVHARSGVPRRREHVLDLARRGAPPHRRAPALVGDRLAPPDLVADEPRAFDARRRGGDLGGGERGTARTRRGSRRPWLQRYAETVRHTGSRDGRTVDRSSPSPNGRSVRPGGPGMERQPSPAPARDDTPRPRAVRDPRPTGPPVLRPESTRWRPTRPPRGRGAVLLRAVSAAVRARRSAALHETIGALAAAGPRFISVTYGAGGSTGGRSLERAAAHPRDDRDPAARAPHVRRERRTPRPTALIREFLDAGITSFLALRGDPPVGAPEDDDFLGDLESAASSCSSSTGCRPSARPTRRRRPRRARAPPGWSGAARSTIAVAAFPNGHPRSRHPHAGHRHAPREAGRRCDPRDHAAVLPRRRLPRLRRARARGRRRHAHPPRHHADHLARPPAPRPRADRRGAPRRARRRTRGRADGRGAARRRHRPRRRARPRGLAGGAPGVHLYAFNHHDTVLAVLREAGILTHRPADQEATSMTDTRTRVPDRHDPRLPAHRATPRAQARRRGVLGRHASTRANSRRPPPTCVARRASVSPSSVSAATTPRSRSRSRTTTRCSTPRSRSARSPSASRDLVDADGAIDLAGYFTVARGAATAPRSR